MVGHDWGGPIAWGATHENPDMVRLMISANGPHPDIMTNLLLTDPEQQAASSYMDWFIQEGTEDALIDNDCAMLDSFFTGVLDEEELEIYHDAWLQENAIKSGLHWYRANLAEEALRHGYFDEVRDKVRLAPSSHAWGRLRCRA